MESYSLKNRKDLTDIPNFDLDMFTQNQFEEIEGVAKLK